MKEFFMKMMKLMLITGLCITGTQIFCTETANCDTPDAQDSSSLVAPTNNLAPEANKLSNEEQLITLFLNYMLCAQSIAHSESLDESKEIIAECQDTFNTEMVNLLIKGSIPRALRPYFAL